MCSLRACHMWLTRNHMFIREIWGKFTSFIFWNFEISLVSLGRFQNFKKVNSVNLSQISLLNMWLLAQIYLQNLNIQHFRRYIWSSLENAFLKKCFFKVFYCVMFQWLNEYLNMRMRFWCFWWGFNVFLVQNIRINGSNRINLNLLLATG